MPNKVFYDMHIHSCLSPCGDEDMTPCNIAGMASIKGINVVALTDHNTCGNCSSFYKACQKMSLVPIAGVEITTSEDIHVIALFDSLEGAMDFNEFIASKRIFYKNDPDIFGRQIYVDSDDLVIGEEEYLLVNSVDISIDDVNSIVKTYGGVSYPAHVDKMSNSILSVFGMIPEMDFTAYEFADLSKADELQKKFEVIKGKSFITSSDAHYLWDINERLNYFTVDSDVSSPDDVRKEIFSILRGDKH